MLNAILLEFGQDSFQIRPAFNRVNIYVLITGFVKFCLNYGIVSIGYLRRTMCHNQNGVIFALFGELRGQSLDGFSHIISLFFLTLPIHQRSA